QASSVYGKLWQNGRTMGHRADLRIGHYTLASGFLPMAQIQAEPSLRMTWTSEYPALARSWRCSSAVRSCKPTCADCRSRLGGKGEVAALETSALPRSMTPRLMTRKISRRSLGKSGDQKWVSTAVTRSNMPSGNGKAETDACWTSTRPSSIDGAFIFFVAATLVSE